MISVPYFFIAIILVKVVLNLVKYFQCKHYLKEYQDYIGDRNWEFIEHQPQIINLFKQAGIEDSFLPHIEPVGFGFVSKSNVSVFNNLGANDTRVIEITFHKFHQAMGVYRSRLIEALNPLYWIEFLVNLPARILTYLGVPPESIVIKIFQLMYWLMAVIIGFIFGLYRQALEQFIKNWLASHVP